MTKLNPELNTQMLRRVKHCISCFLNIPIGKVFNFLRLFCLVELGTAISPACTYMKAHQKDIALSGVYISYVIASA